MNLRKRLGSRIRGWLPKETNVPNLKTMVNHANMSKKRKITVIIGASALVIGSFLLFTIILTIVNPIYPTDSKIINTLNQNENYLLNIPNVVGAGIARNNSNNYIIGIAVYIADNATNTHEIPQRLGDFTVFIIRISDVSQFDRDHMIVRREGWQ